MHVQGFLYIYGFSFMHAIEQLQKESNNYHNSTTEGIEPEIRHPVEIPTQYNDNLGDYGSHKNCISAYKPEEEGQQKNPQNITVEN